MADIHVASSALIPAPPAVVYGILADYEHGHPNILPPEYFRNYRLLAGGGGEGTRIGFEMRAFGRNHPTVGEVTEPEPGRRLVERYPATGIVTTFLIEPVDGGRRSRVTFETRYSKPGLRGLIESWLSPRYLRKVYSAELARLAEVAAASSSELRER